MPYSEFLECWAYEQLEPYGEKGNYLRAGTEAALLANIHRDSKKRNQPYTPNDIFPDVDVEQRAAENSARVMHEKFALFAAMHNEKVVKGYA